MIDLIMFISYIVIAAGALTVKKPAFIKHYLSRKSLIFSN